MEIEIIMKLSAGMGGLLVLVFLYWIYVSKKKQRRENRINRVVTRMMDGHHNIISLLHRLFLSGILDLEDGKEIIEACYRIEAQGGKNPIPDNSGLSSDNLKHFFSYVSVNEIYLSQIPIKKAIKTYKDEMTLKMAA